MNEPEVTIVNPMSILFDKLLYNADMSYYELAKRTGIDRSNLRKMATGRITMTVEAAEKIADAFGVNIEYFTTAYFQTTGMPLPVLEDFLRARYNWITYKDCSEVEALVNKLAELHGISPGEKENGTELSYRARLRNRRARPKNNTGSAQETDPANS